RSLPEGFSLYALNLKQKQPQNGSFFRLSRFSYNRFRLYEEWRIEGVIEEGGKEWNLKPESCRLYSNKSPEKTWVLIRVIDCEHNPYTFNIKNGILILKPGLFSERTLSLFPQENNSQIPLQIIKWKESTVYAWNPAIRGIKARKSTKAFSFCKSSENNNFKFIETLDSTALFFFEGKEISPEIGDLIYIQVIKKSDFP
ncbi:MAG: hypothetical protein KDK45_22260, partial [Leptospiraceae bacterium]|nr:hypothetical protein [Leptospiraceae bacterium]